MALNINSSIFDADPDSAPREPVEYKGPEFTVSAYDHDGTSPVQLAGWMFKTDLVIARAVNELYGGMAEEFEHKFFGMKAFTTATSLPIIIHDVKMPRQLWNGPTLLHECDGRLFLSDPPGPGSTGDPCGCEGKTIRELKDAAKGKYGPKPAIRIKFQLAQDRALGMGELQTSSWDFEGELGSWLGKKLIAAESADSAGLIFADLDISVTEFEIKKGPQKGTHVSYNSPTLRNVRPLDAANAEDTEEPGY